MILAHSKDGAISFLSLYLMPAMQFGMHAALAVAIVFTGPVPAFVVLRELLLG